MCLQKLIDALVYQHLIDKNLLKTAQILKEERIKFYSKKDFEDQRVSETLSVVISRYFQKTTDKNFDIIEKSLDNKTEYLYFYDNPENWKQGKCLVCQKALGQEDMLNKQNAAVKLERKEKPVDIKKEIDDQLQKEPLNNKVEYLYSYDDPKNWKPCRKCLNCEKAFGHEDMLKNQNAAVHEGIKAQEKFKKQPIGKLEKREDYQEFALPFGWRKVGQKRAKSNKWDFLVFNPEGKKFRSNVKVNKYLENKSEITSEQKA